MILVTGASGFIGRILCPALINSGYSVRAQFRQQSPAVPGVDNVITESLGPDTDWSSALRGCEAVIHLAAHAHESSVFDPAACRSVNALGTLRLAEEAAAAGVRRFVFASTVKVHGEGSELAYCESDKPAPQNIYASSKWAAEQGLHEIAARTGMAVVIVRFPLVYGPGVGANFLRLMRSVERGVPLPLGCIKNRRSLIYVGNLVSALQACLADAAANKTFLVADGEDVSTPALIRRLALALGRPLRMLPVPQPILRAVGVFGARQQVQRLLGSLFVDDDFIRRELGWTPPYSLQDGLVATATWFKATR